MGEKTDHIELMVQNGKIIKKGSFYVFSLFKRLHISRLSCTLILTAFPGKKERILLIILAKNGNLVGVTLLQVFPCFPS